MCLLCYLAVGLQLCMQQTFSTSLLYGSACNHLYDYISHLIISVFWIEAGKEMESGVPTDQS